MTSSQKYVPSITMLRGIACLGVCFMHFVGTIHSDSLNTFARFGGWGVPLFFVISGFILPYSLEHGNYKLKNYFSFILKRLIRLEPAYLCSILAVFTLSILAQFSPYNNSVVPDFFDFRTLSHLFYLTDLCGYQWYNPVYWTLAIEFQFYLIIGLLFPLLQLKKIYLQLSILTVFTASSFFFEQHYFLSEYLICFLAGIQLYWYKQSKIELNPFIIFTLILIIFSFMKYGYSGPFCITFAILFIIFTKKEFKFLMFIGKISYSLYLIHTIVGTDAIINFMQNFITSELGRIVLAIFTFPITIFMAWVFHKTIEAPSKKLSKRITYL